METETVKAVKHTVTPWVIEHAQNKKNCFAISSIEHDQYTWKEFATVYTHSVFPGQGEANAKLIAAAPETLQALKDLLNQVTKDCSISSDPKYFDLLEKCQNAIQAIKKATK